MKKRYGRTGIMKQADPCAPDSIVVPFVSNICLKPYKEAYS